MKRYQDLQDILGDHQDGVVAADLLRRIAAGTAQYPDENGFTYGLLYAQEMGHAQESRRLADAWADGLLTVAAHGCTGPSGWIAVHPWV